MALKRINKVSKDIFIFKTNQDRIKININIKIIGK